MPEGYQQRVSDRGREAPEVQGAYIYTDDIRTPRVLVKVLARIEG